MLFTAKDLHTDDGKYILSHRCAISGLSHVPSSTLDRVALCAPFVGGEAGGVAGRAIVTGLCQWRRTLADAGGLPLGHRNRYCLGERWQPAW